ncbi:hypothetical protein MCP_1369 [Methanocella paludicola SANAE]|uniref:Uncharacterized protein n=1 Tax=Methanocella paludicola (strain DSM 17711 / JCM 13418 / NBRC 101707 / SANAE) TaxID=304371 RepID=D1YYB9_METPS|nr:hypothetical protein [Methanocella paludicola]BAI61441.1 hypothetical protein MCP_1369 [Methanocella paludicola SANAE]
MMTDGFKKVEDLTEQTTNRRRRLNEKDSSIKQEKVDRAEFYSEKKRGEYITDNRKETPNIETEPNQ